MEDHPGIFVEGDHREVFDALFGPGRDEAVTVLSWTLKVPVHLHDGDGWVNLRFDSDVNGNELLEPDDLGRNLTLRRGWPES